MPEIMLSRLRVLHVITGLGDGGAESILVRLCLFKQDVEHVVVSLTKGGKYGPILERAGIQVYYLGMKPGWPSLSRFLKLIQLIRQVRPDVVQTWMYHADLLGGLAARFSGVQRVFWGIHHSSLEIGKSKRVTMLVAKLCAYLSGLVPKSIVCCAKKGLDVHVDIGYRKEKMLVIPNGYNLAEYKPDNEARFSVRKEFCVKDDEFFLGMVARFDPLKDHHNLLRALFYLKERKYFKCLLVGKNVVPDNQELVVMIESLGLRENIILAGQRTDIPDIMNALDLHVLSSCSEAFPNVLAEAMACGTYCVATDVGDASLIVGDTGWVVPASDSIELSKSLVQALQSLDDRACRHKRSAAARQRVQDNFSIERMVSNYHQVWQS